MNTIHARRIEAIGFLIALAGILLILLAGCSTLESLLRQFLPPDTRIELTNNGDFVVDAVLYIDDEQDIPRELLVEFGEKIEVSIEPGETRVLSRLCPDLQAVVLDDADLRVIGGAGPETSTDVLRDGSDFGCRDTIVFMFDHGDVVFDFDVEVTVRE